MVERVWGSFRWSVGLLVAFAIAAVGMAAPVLGQAEGGAAASGGASSASVAHGRGDIAGDWQGTLVFPGSGGQPGGRFRLVLKIAKTAGGGWSALNYSIDQGPTPMHTSAVSLKGDEFRFSIPALGGSYAGRVSADGNSIKGTWTQGAALPLDFVRATAQTAWAIPAPAAPVKPMATDADPSYEVATIKPSAPGSADKYFRVYGRRFMAHDTSLIDLMEVAYGVHSTQIIKAPAWASEEKFDLVGVPDGIGEPNAGQWTRMLQKLLVDRFQLRFHHSQKELSVYVLAVGKDGPKNLTKSESSGPLPSLEFNPGSGGLTLPARNATLGQLASMMQAIVLDKPVVDKTGVSGRYDFQLTFKPNDSEFNGHPPQSASAIADDTAPELFEAIQQQLGLKLSMEKIPTDVMVIDRVEKPSAN